jgi:hypothetical protein
MFKTLEYIVRGLYRHDVAVLLPPQTRVSIAHIDTMDAPGIIKPILEFPRRGPFFRGQRLVVWFSVHSDEDPYSTLWALEFNENVYFLGGTGQLARPVDEPESGEGALQDETAN